MRPPGITLGSTRSSFCCSAGKARSGERNWNRCSGPRYARVWRSPCPTPAASTWLRSTAKRTSRGDGPSWSRVTFSAYGWSIPPGAGSAHGAVHGALPTRARPMPSARHARCFADAPRRDGGSARTIAGLEEWTNDGSDFGDARRFRAARVLEGSAPRSTFSVIASWCRSILETRGAQGWRTEVLDCFAVVVRGPLRKTAKGRSAQILNHGELSPMSSSRFQLCSRLLPNWLARGIRARAHRDLAQRLTGTILACLSAERFMTLRRATRPMP